MASKIDLNPKTEYSRDQIIDIVKMVLTIIIVTLGLYLAMDLSIVSSLLVGITSGLVGLTWATKIPPRNRSDEDKNTSQ